VLAFTYIQLSYQHSMTYIEKYKQNIQNLLNDEATEPYLYWKGRVGLYALLKAMDIKEGDEIILPAYTCVVVPNAILYLGAKPIYVDVLAGSYNMDIAQVKSAITTKTKVIICQNTYGLSTDLEELQNLAQVYNLFTIEDCTHGFGGYYNGIPNGLSCDAGIYSTQWNKPFSTGIGGFVISTNTEITKKLREVNADLITPSSNELFKLKLLFFVKRYLINQYNYWPMIHFYRWLSHNTPLVVGSSSAGEINSIQKPDNYFKAFSDVQAKEGIRNIRSLRNVIENQKKNAETYTNFLIKLNKNHVEKKWFANHSFLKYPLLVKNRDKFMVLAEKNRIKLGEWFISPLHPVQGDLSAWQFENGKYPIAEYLASHVVNLPTTDSDMTKVLSFLEKHADFIIDGEGNIPQGL